MSEIDKGQALFLDDERYPPKNGYEWIILRTFDEATNYVTRYGMPPYASFDHDLGENSKTGYEFVKWLVEYDLDSGNTIIPSEFTYYVHSQNPVGAANIRGYLDSYLDMRGSQWKKDES